MNQNCAYADRLARGQGAQDGVTQKIAPKPSSLHAAVDRQTAKQHDRDWIGHVPFDPTCRRTGK